MKLFSQKSNTGFTLIEAILYLAIAGTVLYFISGFAFNSIFGKAKIETYQQVNENSRSVLDEISKAVGDSSEINGIVTGVSSGDGEDNGPVVTEGLISYYSFDGDMLDHQGTNHNDGTCSEDSCPTLTTGVKDVPNTAYSFDGDNAHYILAPSLSSAYFGSEKLSVSLWIKSNSTPNNYGEPIADLGSGEAGYNGFYIETHSDYIAFVTENNTYLQYNTPTDTTTDGLWHHVVGTREVIDGVAYRNLYVDDVLVASDNTTPTSIVSTAPNMVIGNYETFTYPWDGSIDNVRIYNRALTADEVTTIYNAEKPQ